MSKSERMADIHAEAMREFDIIQSAMRDERMMALQDRRFYSLAGAQWEGQLGEQFENKPRFEVNKIHLAVIRVVNEYRNNRITVDFVSKDGGDEYDQLAETCDGLYRADEQDSGANEAYDNAFEEAVGGGFGAWRLRTVYEDEEDSEDEKQRIRIEPIFDADSCVFFDLNAKRQDKADAKRCFVLTAMTRDAYEEEWGDDPASWPKDVFQTEFDWLTPDLVYVAEYYRVEEYKETIRVFELLDGEEERHSDADLEANDGALLATLTNSGAKEVRQKRVTRKRVRKYILSGAKVLEDCGYIAGRNIPIVPMYGKRWFIDGVERCMGHVRLAKDAQRLKNMQLSKLGEISALSTVEKPILMPEQIAGHQMMWAQDNVKNYPYLLVNPITDANGQTMPSGPVAYTRSPQLPPAMAALLQITEQDMQDLLGNQQGADKVVSNISGKAVDLIQQRLDMQTFIYMSNMAKAVKRSGEIWLSMAKEIFVEEGRAMKAITPQGKAQKVELLKPVVDENGKIEIQNDLSEADFDLAVDVGPSSNSRRQATVRDLIGMMQVTQDPETLQVLSAMAVMNMQGEGLGDVNDFFRAKLVKMGAVKPTEKEVEELQAMAQNQQPSPQDVYLMSAAKEAEAKAMGAQANTVLTLAKSEQTKAQTVETLANVSNNQRKAAIETAQAISSVLQQNTGVPPGLNGVS